MTYYKADLDHGGLVHDDVLDTNEVDDTILVPHDDIKKSRTGLTHNACVRCRQRKSKCDGDQTGCQRCLSNGLKCNYNGPSEGVTRTQHLQTRLKDVTEECGKLAALFTAMQESSDDDAWTLLARLRQGATVDELAPFPGPDLTRVNLRPGSRMGPYFGSAPTHSRKRSIEFVDDSAPDNSWSLWNAQYQSGIANPVPMPASWPETSQPVNQYGFSAAPTSAQLYAGQVLGFPALR